MKSKEMTSMTLPAKKTIRSKLIQRVQSTMNVSVSQIEMNGMSATAINRLPGKRQSNGIGKVRRENMKKRRTGPNGKRAMVSDEAVERIAADMEKRTRLAIRLIGRSRGF